MYTPYNDNVYNLYSNNCGTGGRSMNRKKLVSEEETLYPCYYGDGYNVLSNLNYERRFTDRVLILNYSPFIHNIYNFFCVLIHSIYEGSVTMKEEDP